jgi:hypothetical protein
MRTIAASTTIFAAKPPAPVFESEDWNPVSNSTAQTAPVIARDNDDAEDRNDKERLVEEGGKETSLPCGACLSPL